MTYPITTLHYHQHALEAVEIGGQKWLRVPHLVPPLGLSSPRAVMKIYENNRDEFSAEETCLAPLETAGGEQNVRLFSLRGVRLLALLAHTLEAKAFRRWVLDLLEGRVRSIARQPIAPLPTESQIMLRELSNLPPAMLSEAIADYLTGRRSLPEIGPLAAMRQERTMIVTVIAEYQGKLRDLYARARKLGYRPETLKWQPPAQSALTFDVSDDADPA
jgi:prophage antirepressor-like protein